MQQLWWYKSLSLTLNLTTLSLFLLFLSLSLCFSHSLCLRCICRAFEFKPQPTALPWLCLLIGFPAIIPNPNYSCPWVKTNKRQSRRTLFMHPRDEVGIY